MIRNNIESNEKIQPNSREINFLKNNLPCYFDKDGNFQVDKFIMMLKTNEITITKEGYQLNFLGKSYARFQTSTET